MPEGIGGASPFSMGLNALVTRNVSGYVKVFKVCGKWKDYDLEDYAKIGRVPDGSMMLNMLVRAAIDRMPALESFTYELLLPRKLGHILTDVTSRWELDTKMLPTVWLGLAQRLNLTTLVVKAPSGRAPRPSLLVPPIPNLKTLIIKNIDPLCYPDNISLLLEGSKKLEHLSLHWSPRMRESREPSVNLHSYFGRVIAAHYKMPLKSIAFQNLYAHNESLFQQCLDPEKIESFTMISSVSGNDDAADLAFVEHGWRYAPPRPRMKK